MSDARLPIARALMRKSKATLGRLSVAKPTGIASWARANLLSVVGLGLIDKGVFDANHIAGWIVAGVSVLVLDYKVDGE